MPCRKAGRAFAAALPQFPDPSEGGMAKPICGRNRRKCRKCHFRFAEEKNNGKTNLRLVPAASAHVVGYNLATFFMA
jgi:hypothetical protein